jgi:tetratricopeptide (TPR) repeat protein
MSAIRTTFLVFGLLLSGAVHAQLIGGPKPPPVAPPTAGPASAFPKHRFGNLPPVKADLLVQSANKDVEPIHYEMTLLGRQENMILMQGTQPGAIAIQIDKAQIIRCEFELEYDRLAVATAVQNSDWASAVRIMTPVIRPAVAYLDIPDNNGFDLSMDLAMFMVNSAAREMRVASDSNTVSRAYRQYEAAYSIFKNAGRSDWNPYGRVAVLKGCRALIKQNKIEEAITDYETVDEPEPDDVSYGNYWLVRGEIHFVKGKIREALEAACKSVVLANKDVETFPDALMLSAVCYQKLGRFHRARDIFYEVAVIFTGTDWATDALVELTKIMDAKQTLDKEKAPLENVFFNVTEDINKLAEELIKARAKKEEPAKSPATETKK